MGAVSLTCPLLPGTTFICSFFFCEHFVLSTTSGRERPSPPFLPPPSPARPPPPLGGAGGEWGGGTIIQFDPPLHVAFSPLCTVEIHAWSLCPLRRPLLKKKTGEGFEPPNDDMKKVSVSYLSLQQRPTYIQTEGVALVVGVLTSDLTIFLKKSESFVLPNHDSKSRSLSPKKPGEKKRAARRPAPRTKK